ncbi:hypothetical protein [Psychrobacter sanguinis]|uniref:hypothetical protein n=1 Tax=Psychrobacter sanguinis TaxID=861445 RepID=UPI00020C937D|nr:hypothetical protein [Psychrobacter sanguinis]EGK14559.1 hypothetical protein HMPREF9373_0762 [Psychrobacter sp. 1501(2011)]MCD9150851.1 hypothetical protein [Psychrobacter sanguinis]
MKSDRRDRFERVASKRVERVINDIRLLSNCSNTNNYEYTSADVDKMLKAIRDEIKLLEASFKSGARDLDEGFKF